MAPMGTGHSQTQTHMHTQINLPLNRRSCHREATAGTKAWMMRTQQKGTMALLPSGCGKPSHDVEHSGSAQIANEQARRGWGEAT